MTAPRRFTVSIVGENVAIPVDVMASVDLAPPERRDYSLTRECPPPWDARYPEDKMTLFTAVTFAEVLKLLELLGVPHTGMPPEEID